METFREIIMLKYEKKYNRKFGENSLLLLFITSHDWKNSTFMSSCVRYVWHFSHYFFQCKVSLIETFQNFTNNTVNRNRTFSVRIFSICKYAVHISQKYPLNFESTWFFDIFYSFYPVPTVFRQTFSVNLTNSTLNRNSTLRIIKHHIPSCTVC